MAAEREKDTIYYLSFVPKDGQATGRSTLFNEPWCVRIFGNPHNHPKLIEDAIRTFEKRHQVNSWRDIALKHQIDALYYP